MAKRKAGKKSGLSEKPDEAEGAPAAEAKSGARQGGSAQAPDFFGSLREGFKAAGETAERYARMGINIAELEGLRLKLKAAYATLGESVTRCWDAAPDLGVAANDPAIKQQVKAVNEMRRRIREAEIKLRNLKQSS